MEAGGSRKRKGQSGTWDRWKERKMRELWSGSTSGMKKASTGEKERQQTERGRARHVCGQLGAQRPGGESMGRRWPLRGQAVHWATIPSKLACCISHKTMRLQPWAAQPLPEMPHINKAKQNFLMQPLLHGPIIAPTFAVSHKFVALSFSKRTTTNQAQGCCCFHVY